MSNGSISYSSPGTPRGDRGDQERLMRGYDVESQPQQFGLADLAEDSGEEDGIGNGNATKLQTLKKANGSRPKMNGSHASA